MYLFSLPLDGGGMGGGRTLNGFTLPLIPSHLREGKHVALAEADGIGNMIAGIGIDLVKIKRIQDAVQRWDRRFLNRIFTPLEQQYCFARLDPHLHLSGRFAVKEAVFKALGTGWRSGVRWTEIEVLNNPMGKPMVMATGMVKQLMADLGVTEIHVSISHDTDYAIGQVILSKAKSPRAKRKLTP